MCFLIRCHFILPELYLFWSFSPWGSVSASNDGGTSCDFDLYQQKKLFFTYSTFTYSHNHKILISAKLNKHGPNITFELNLRCLFYSLCICFKMIENVVISLWIANPRSRYCLVYVVCFLTEIKEMLWFNFVLGSIYHTLPHTKTKENKN